MTLLITLLIFVISFLLVIIFAGIFTKRDPFLTRLATKENQRNFDAGVLEGRLQERQWQEIKKELEELKSKQ